MSWYQLILNQSHKLKNSKDLYQGKIRRLGKFRNTSEYPRYRTMVMKLFLNIKSSIMGIMNQTGVIEGNDLFFGDEGLNFDDFIAG